ncbi:MAG: hypothetical protein LQ352_008433, partial [Teloschistes flavicans]
MQRRILIFFEDLVRALCFGICYTLLSPPTLALGLIYGRDPRVDGIFELKELVGD